MGSFVQLPALFPVLSCGLKYEICKICGLEYKICKKCGLKYKICKICGLKYKICKIYVCMFFLYFVWLYTFDKLMYCSFGLDWACL